MIIILAGLFPSRNLAIIYSVNIPKGVNIRELKILKTDYIDCLHRCLFQVIPAHKFCHCLHICGNLRNINVRSYLRPIKSDSEWGHISSEFLR